MGFPRAFDHAFQDTLGLEGGYVNHPDDPGGETKYGITKRSYPDVDIAALTVEDARAIYYRDFWRPLMLDQVLDDQVAAEIFDTAVNMGRGRAVKIAQRACNFLGSSLAVDGAMGPKTLAAIDQWIDRDPEALFKALNGFQFTHYADLVDRTEWAARFARGWMRRIQSYRRR